MMADRELEFWDEDGKAFRAIVQRWPESVRQAMGGDLRRVQRNESPLNGKPLKDFPLTCAEIRHRSGGRIVYSVAYTEISGKVFIVDAFMKDSADVSEMRAAVRRRIQQRLKDFKAKYEKLRRQGLH